LASLSDAEEDWTVRFVRTAIASLLLASVLPLVLTVDGILAASYPLSPSDSAVQAALDYLRGQQSSDGDIGGFGNSAFVCMAVAAAGENPDLWVNGGPSLVDYLKAGPADMSGEFNMGTFLSRMVLAAVAAGESPSAFGSWSGAHLGVTVTDGDYLGALKSLHNGTQFLQDLTGDPDSAETLNDDFWGVRALIVAGESPSSALVQSAVQFIIDNQEADGGWTWGTASHTWYMPDSSDVDNTAAALVALCLAGQDGVSVADGLTFLSGSQDAGGGFTSIWTGVNVQSTAWAVDAIAAGGGDPTGADWTPVASTPIDYLLAQQESDGSFSGMVRSTADVLLSLLGPGGGIRAARARPVSVGGEALVVDGVSLLAVPVALCAGLLTALWIASPSFRRIMRRKSCSRTRSAL